MNGILSNPQMLPLLAQAMARTQNESFGGLMERRLGTMGWPTGLTEGLKARMKEAERIKQSRALELQRMRNMNRGILANPMGMGEFLGILSGGAL